MINSANRESNAHYPARRQFLINMGTALGTAVVAETLAPFAALASSPRQAAVRLSEVALTLTQNELGQTISEQRGVTTGNHFVLTPTQERGRERTQRVLVKMFDGEAREMVSVQKSDGNSELRSAGDTFVFKGFKDTSAPVKDRCDDDNKCQQEYWDGMNIDIYRVRPGRKLEFVLTFPTAFDCEPRSQRLIDTIIVTHARPTSTPEPTHTPVILPTETPAPVKPPVQVPVQVPRKSEAPSLEEEFGSVAVSSSQEQLGRVIYE